MPTTNLDTKCTWKHCSLGSTCTQNPTYTNLMTLSPCITTLTQTFPEHLDHMNILTYVHCMYVQTYSHLKITQQYITLHSNLHILLHPHITPTPCTHHTYTMYTSHPHHVHLSPTSGCSRRSSEGSALQSDEYSFTNIWMNLMASGIVL